MNRPDGQTQTDIKGFATTLTTAFEWYKRAWITGEKYKWGDVTGEGEGDLERQGRTIRSIKSETQRILNTYGEDQAQKIAQEWTKLVMREGSEKVLTPVVGALALNFTMFGDTNIGTLIVWSVILYLVNLKIKFKPYTPDERSRYDELISDLENQNTLKIGGKELQITGAIYDILVKKSRNAGKSK